MCPGDFYLNRMLNEQGISSAFLYPDFKFSLETVMAVKYSRYGVFLDLHCAYWYSNFILTEVSLKDDHSDTVQNYSWINIVSFRVQDSKPTTNPTPGYCGEKVCLKVCK